MVTRGHRRCHRSEQAAWMPELGQARPHERAQGPHQAIAHSHTQQEAEQQGPFRSLGPVGAAWTPWTAWAPGPGLGLAWDRLGAGA